jgi:uncharacterized protein (DUF697 family)
MSTVTPEQQKAASAVVNKYLPWSMGLGFVPAPLIVVGGLTAIQLKMLADISKVYGVEFSENRVRSIVTSLLGAVVPAAIGGSVGGFLLAIPVVGPFLLPVTMPLLAGAATYATGKTFIQHFESGGTYLDFDPAGAKTLFSERFAEGKAEAGKVTSSFKSSLNAKLARMVEL